jgi:hypothetical protein
MALVVSSVANSSQHTAPSRGFDRLPDALLIEIYKFLAGDPAVQGFPALTLSKRGVCTLGLLSYNCHRVIAPYRIASLFQAVIPLVKHIRGEEESVVPYSPYHLTPYDHILYQLEDLTGINFRLKLEENLKPMEKSGKRPLWRFRVAPEQAKDSINRNWAIVHKLQLGNFTDLFASLQSFNLFMDGEQRTIRANEMIKDTAFNLDEALRLGASMPFMEQMMLAALTIGKYDVIKGHLNKEQVTQALLNVYSKRGQNVAHYAVFADQDALLEEIFNNPRLHPLLFELDLEKSNIAHLAVCHKSEKALAFIEGNQLLQPLMIAKDGRGRMCEDYRKQQQAMMDAAQERNQTRYPESDDEYFG